MASYEKSLPPTAVIQAHAGWSVVQCRRGEPDTLVDDPIIAWCVHLDEDDERDVLLPLCVRGGMMGDHRRYAWMIRSPDGSIHEPACNGAVYPPGQEDIALHVLRDLWPLKVPA